MYETTRYYQLFVLVLALLPLRSDRLRSPPTSPTSASSISRSSATAGIRQPRTSSSRRTRRSSTRSLQPRCARQERRRQAAHHAAVPARVLRQAERSRWARSSSARSSRSPTSRRAKKLSVVVDKRIVIYGGQDITSDVVNAVRSSAGDRRRRRRARALGDRLRRSDRHSQTRKRSRTRAMQLQKFQDRAAADLRERASRTPRPTSTSSRSWRTTTRRWRTSKNELLKPLVDQTKSATANVARSKNSCSWSIAPTWSSEARTSRKMSKMRSINRLYLPKLKLCS